MSTLTELRADLALVVGGGTLTVHDHLPPQLHPPVALLEPGDPYLTDTDQDMTFGEHAVRFEVYLVTPAAQPDVQTAALDQMIQDVVARLDGSDWWIERAERPYGLRFGAQGATYLTTRLTAITRTHLGES